MSISASIGATINGCTVVLPLTVLNLSSVEAALVIGPSAFNKDSASLKTAEIVVLHTLSISRSHRIVRPFFHSWRLF